MAETPDKNIEKLLKDYAQQRRDAAGMPEMHLATRRLLHAEVKQQLGSPASASPGTGANWLARFWPRLALACGLLLAIAITASLLPALSKAKNRATLARMDQQNRAQDKRETASLPAPTSALPPAAAPAGPPPAAITVGSVADEGVAREASLSLAGRVEESLKMTVTRGDGGGFQMAAADAASAGVKVESLAFDTSSRDAGKTEFASNDGIPADQLAKLERVEMSGPIQTPALTGNSVVAGEKSFADATPAGLARQSESELAMRYRKADLNDKAKDTAPMAVLADFTVEQRGESLMVVDRDGSVYNGFIRAAATESDGREQSGGRAKQAAAARQASLAESKAANVTAAPAPSMVAPSETMAAQQNFVFRVEGTNRTLKERVIFTGNMMQNTAANAGAMVANVQSFRQQAPLLNVSNTSPPSMQFQNSVINGRVQLGDSKTVTELNALSIGP
jgi:hypothetical protein